MSIAFICLKCNWSIGGVERGSKVIDRKTGVELYG